MQEIRTSGSMSGDGKRSAAAWPKLPRPSSTLPKRRFAATHQFVAIGGIADIARSTAAPGSDANDPSRKWSVHRSSRGCDELIDDSSAMASRLDGMVSSERLGDLEVDHQPEAWSAAEPLNRQSLDHNQPLPVCW
jgi:hypothetical protein